MKNLYKKTASELFSMLKNKKISSYELTLYFINRTKKLDNLIDSFITVCEKTSLETAKLVDQKISNNEFIPNFAGIPIGIKDNISTKNILTTCASKMLSNYIPPYDATVVKKIKKHFLPIIGKLNMDEFAMGSSGEYSFFNVTKNPHNLNYSAGGSSSGSAASVSAGLIPLSLGSDTGGSIRLPASFCGICGLKPTYGTISRYGLIAFSSSLDQIGPLARSIEDLAMLLEIIYSYDKLDSTSILKNNSYSFHKNLNTKIPKLKIGLPKEYFEVDLDEDIKKAIYNAVDEYRKCGHEIIEISIPMLKYVVPTYYILSSAEASSNLGRYDGIKYGYRDNINNTLENLYINSRSNGFGKEVKRRIVLGSYVLASKNFENYYSKAQTMQNLLKNQFNNIFNNVCDIILTPTCPTTAFPLGKALTNKQEAYNSDLYTVTANITGLPALVVPCGYDKNNMPINMQLIGNYLNEQILLNMGFLYENITGFKNILANLKK